ncbi:MAG: flagellar assembly protein FliW [Actinomycetota bacterium]
MSATSLVTDDEQSMSGEDDQVLVLERGIPGLTDAEEFLLSDLGDDEESAFQLLTSVADPDVAMIVAVPWLFFPEYSPELPDGEREALAITTPEEAIVFCPVTLDAENEQIHLNLLGPFVVNAQTRRGRQVVLADSEWPVRAAVELDLS